MTVWIWYSKVDPKRPWLVRVGAHIYRAASVYLRGEVETVYRPEERFDVPENPAGVVMIHADKEEPLNLMSDYVLVATETPDPTPEEQAA